MLNSQNASYEKRVYLLEFKSREITFQQYRNLAKAEFSDGVTISMNIQKILLYL